MKKPDKENKVFYITHSGELLIWLIIIFVFVVFFTFYHIKNEEINNDCTIFLPDVDGLIEGSPVRMMGVEVGHVIKIKPIKDEVFVKFLITNENVVIPQGTQATVEFSGMAGSKSLELYPPNEKTYVDASTPLLTVNPPKRLHDAFGLLNEMFKRIGSMITTTSIFGKNLKTIDMPKAGSAQDLSEFMEYSDKVLDDSIQRAEDFGERIKKYGK
ncbi:MCE family protein [bacterium]|nr:MCE family protein [bacterium]